MIADIGGFIELVKYCFIYLISVFSYKRFMAFIFQEMYFLDKLNYYNPKLNKKVHKFDDKNSLKSVRKTDYASSDISESNMSVQRTNEDLTLI